VIKLVADNPPDDIVQRFNNDTDPPSKGPRIPVDGDVSALPVGDGPGVFPGFPTFTRGFWLGDEPPENILDAIACPVADVIGFLENPLRCMFGIDDDTQEGKGTILDFFSIADSGSAITDAMSDSIIPLAVEVSCDKSIHKFLFLALAPLYSHSYIPQQSHSYNIPHSVCLQLYRLRIF
jgi:hypothetical protein